MPCDNTADVGLYSPVPTAADLFYTGRSWNK